MASDGRSTVAHSAAKAIQVQVGSDGLSFTPNTITAADGDVLEFVFGSANHSVVMGDFNNACQPATSGGFFSGFISITGTDSRIFSVTINSTDPIVFYCSQNLGSHCKNGMSGVVNPAGSSTLENYQNEAKKAKSAGSPPSVFGGVEGSPSSGSSSSSSSSGSTPSSTPGSTPSGTGSTAAGPSPSTRASSESSSSSKTGTTSAPTTTPTSTSHNGTPPRLATNFKAAIGGLLGAVAVALFLV